MAFFDEIGKMITKTGQDVFRKTKDTAETLKLSGMISDEEKRLTGFYAEIGKAYYRSHADSYEPEYESMMRSIEESKAKIAEYSEQVKRLKGIDCCPSCGAEVAYNASFCSACGAKMNADGTTDSED